MRRRSKREFAAIHAKRGLRKLVKQKGQFAKKRKFQVRRGVDWERHRGLVHKIVNARLRPLGVHSGSALAQDLEQEGMIAAWKASRRHDPRRGAPSTLIHRWVTGAVGRALKRQNLVRPDERKVRAGVRVPVVGLEAAHGVAGGNGERMFARRHLEQTRKLLSKREWRILSGMGQGERATAIAKELGISKARVSQIRKAAIQRLRKEAA